MKGLKLTIPSTKMAASYLKMAEDTLGSLDKSESCKIWTAAKVYYVFYYALYAVMLSIGVKCEIHACSLEFMKKFLVPPYSKKDVVMIRKAFINRNNLQYYADRPVSREEIEETKKYCTGFYTATKDIIAGMTLSQAKLVRDKLTEGL